MSDVVLEVEAREERGNNAMHRLRVAGQIPAVVYGGGKDTVAIKLNRKTLLDLMKLGDRENAIFLLKLAGKERHAMIRDLQIDPISRQVVHIDFQRVNMKEKIRVQVPIELTGTAFGVKTEGGLIDFVTREVHVECLPGDIPKRIAYDVTELHVGHHIEAGQLTLPPGITLLEDPHRVIVALSHPKLEATTAEAEAPVEGAVAPAGGEPEVIKKGKTEEA
jgi:large subunit ribosomal protein L25